MIPVILSGGNGSRLWPLSRQAYPKQFLPLVGEQSMLQETLCRLPVDDVFGGGVSCRPRSECPLRHLLGRPLWALLGRPIGHRILPLDRRLRPHQCRSLRKTLRPLRQLLRACVAGDVVLESGIQNPRSCLRFLGVHQATPHQQMPWGEEDERCRCRRFVRRMRIR